MERKPPITRFAGRMELLDDTKNDNDYRELDVLDTSGDHRTSFEPETMPIRDANPEHQDQS